MMMATVTLQRKGPGMKAGKVMKAGLGDPAPGEYALQVDEDGSVTVFGKNSNKENVDISDVATLQATSDNPAALQVDSPNGMSVAYHGAGVGKAKVTLVASENNGKWTFTIDDPCDIAGDAVRGLVINHGTPTAR
jgi:hypothetical protein